jgi:DNA-binding NtrC family response regulator
MDAGERVCCVVCTRNRRGEIGGPEIRSLRVEATDVLGRPEGGAAVYVIREKDAGRLWPDRPLSDLPTKQGNIGLATYFEKADLPREEPLLIRAAYEVATRDKTGRKLSFQGVRSVRSALASVYPGAKRPAGERWKVTGTLAVLVKDEAFTAFLERSERSVMAGLEDGVESGLRSGLWRNAGEEPEEIGGTGAKDYLAADKDDKLQREFIGADPEIRKVRGMAVAYAPRSEPVLITGETGTGKEVIAKALHRLKGRGKGHFRAFSCACTSLLFRSEVFGYKEGSFTGATKDHDGILVNAGGGTVLLDEVGELPAECQPQLLRALAERTVLPIGATEEENFEARVVFATSRDLEHMVDRGEFRAELLYRIHVLGIHIPPLRRRRDDIPLIVSHLWEQLTSGDAAPPTLSSEAVEALRELPWHGNVRELKSALARIHVYCSRGTVSRRMVDAIYAPHRPAATAGAGTAPPGVMRALGHVMDCIDHLKQAAHVLRLCKADLRVFSMHARTSKATIETAIPALRHHLDDLRLITEHPESLHRGAVFDATYRFQSELIRLIGLMKKGQPRRAMRQWKNATSAHFKIAFSLVLCELESVEGRMWELLRRRHSTT